MKKFLFITALALVSLAVECASADSGRKSCRFGFYHRWPNGCQD